MVEYIDIQTSKYIWFKLVDKKVQDKDDTQNSEAVLLSTTYT